jgi:type IV pilus assembly protein PilQ
MKTLKAKALRMKALIKNIPCAVIAVRMLIVFLCLSSCMKEEKAMEGKLIEPKSMLDTKQFIKESKDRSKDTMKFGPKVIDVDKAEVRDAIRTEIDKEDAPNYDKLSDTGTGNVFPIDLNLDGVDIRTFTQMLSRLTGVNFLVSDEVNGTITAKLDNVAWPQALDSVLSLKGFAKHVDNKANIIRIHNQSTIVQLEGFERQRKADLQKTVMLEKSGEPMYTEIFKLFYTKPADVKTILENVLGGKAAAAAEGADGRSTSAQITTDERVNQLIIKARKADIELVRKLITKIDSRTKQVFIEAFIVEVSDNFEKALGTQLGVNAATSAGNRLLGGKKFNSRLLGVGADPTLPVSEIDNPATVTSLAAEGATSGIAALVGIGDTADLRVALTALEKDSVSKIISNPRIFTLDNQEATIFQGDDIPYATTSSEGTTTEFKKAGLKLTVKPTVVGDGNLMMAVTLNKDSADTSQANPPISTSQIITNMVTKDGSIVVIGGIYTQTKADSENKVPFFGDIPGAGKLFRNDTRKNNRKELMIFISPRVI